MANANLRAQQATIDRLKALTAFENVTAPFDGVVTARNVEVGDLVNANSGTGAPMFTVDQDDVLRIAVQVPQYASALKGGEKVVTSAPVDLTEGAKVKLSPSNGAAASGAGSAPTSARRRPARRRNR